MENIKSKCPARKRARERYMSCNFLTSISYYSDWFGAKTLKVMKRKLFCWQSAVLPEMKCRSFVLNFNDNMVDGLKPGVSVWCDRPGEGRQQQKRATPWLFHATASNRLLAIHGSPTDYIRRIKTDLWLIINLAQVFQPIPSWLNWPTSFNWPDL